MYLALRKLNVLGSVLYIAAHPDDENTRLLSYFSKDRMYRTGYLSLTRGDGGQNLIGNEQGIELGLIRTQELLSARRIDGAEQFFSRAFDFGFSKNPEETFTKWDREKILSDVVWVIRKFQPDIIITRFPTTGEGGHGHHTASAILANEAFTAAADPGRFPEQLKYVRVWQAKRIMWNTFNFGNTNTTSSSQFQLDVGGYNPLLGKSYGEIAAESRSQHKSQGFGVARSRGAAIEFFKTTGGNAPTNDLMDDVDLGWKKIPGGEKISGIIDSLSSSFDLLHPENSVKGLVRLYQALTLLPSGYWRDQKLKEVQQLVEQCSALFLDATTTDQFAVQTDTVKINFVLNNRLGVNAKLKELRLDAFDSSFMQDLPKNRNIAFSKGFFVPLSKSISQPYWLKETMEEGYFNVSDQQKIGQPDVDPAYVANMSINIEGQDFSFSRAVKYKFTDPVKGELYQPVFVIPAATVSSSPDVLLFTQRKAQADKKTVLLQANANKNLQGSAAAQLRSMDKDLWKKDPSFSLARNSSRVYSFEFDNENMRTRDNAYGFVHIDTGKDSLEAYLTLRAINYDHIPSVKYFYSDAIKLLNIDLKTVGKKIGYIVGAGDKVPEALEQMGYEVTLLADKDLAKNNLQQYDAIITGVRAYNTDFFLNSYYDKLMSYVSDGGNLIVQYNTNNNIGPVRARIGPYNFDIVNVRVTDENAQVNFLKPDHPILNFPNKITDEDFKGWRQERSIYHASNLDPRFETIFSMHDPGEASDNGALITTKYGKGTFTYTGIVFFRELPAGVPGAYRLLANLIALSNKKAF
jgi:LmbE family N-acetylglucosaminyl deacetylase